MLPEDAAQTRVAIFVPLRLPQSSREIVVRAAMHT
jgi:hypothetical protein